jgi:hypothetical protein
MSLHKQISPRGFEVLFFSEESVDDRWVKTVTALLGNVRSRLFMVVGGFVSSAGSQGVVDIDDCFQSFHQPWHSSSGQRESA